MRLAFSLSPLTLTEFMEQVDAWAEVLWETIPSNELNAAYLRAMKGRKDRFPLGASELLEAHRGMKAEEIRSSECQYCLAKEKQPDLPNCPFHGGEEAPATGDLRGTEIKSKQ